LTMYCRRGAGCQSTLCSAWVSRKITPVAGSFLDNLLPRRSSAHFDLDVAEMGFALGVSVEIVNAHLSLPDRL
jgi:hypothetical protein